MREAGDRLADRRETFVFDFFLLGLFQFLLELDQLGDIQGHLYHAVDSLAVLLEWRRRHDVVCLVSRLVYPDLDRRRSLS